MAKQYPRFIFSHPFDTKSKERFIVHTQHPQMIAKVTYLPDGGHQVDPVDTFVPVDKETINNVVYRMYDWYTHIRMQEAKLSFDFYDRTSDIARKLASHDFFYHGTVSISMIFIPVMGSRLEIAKDEWRISIDFENDDTYESTLKKLKGAYKEKYLIIPAWPV